MKIFSISGIKNCIVAIALLTALAACSSNDVLTKEEIRIQNAADAEVANVLFDRELTDTASYNVHKNGHVVIRFDESVKSAVYTEVVDTLRANAAIKSVYAEQAGKEVCALP